MAISQDRNCRYCSAAHIACCRMLGVHPNVLESMVRNIDNHSDPKLPIRWHLRESAPAIRRALRPQTIKRCSLTATRNRRSWKSSACRPLLSTPISWPTRRRWRTTRCSTACKTSLRRGLPFPGGAESTDGRRVGAALSPRQQALRSPSGRETGPASAGLFIPPSRGAIAGGVTIGGIGQTNGAGGKAQRAAGPYSPRVGNGVE